MSKVLSHMLGTPVIVWSNTSTCSAHDIYQLRVRQWLPCSPIGGRHDTVVPCTHNSFGNRSFDVAGRVFKEIRNRARDRKLAIETIEAATENILFGN